MLRGILLVILLAFCACEPNISYEPACFDAAGIPRGTLMLVTGADAWVDQVRVIDDGDSCNNAEHGATATDLASRTTHLRNAVPGVAPSIIVQVNLAAFYSSNWVAGSTVTFGTWVNSTTSSAGGLVFHVPTTLKGKITAVKVHVTGTSGAGAGHAALPATKPILSLVRHKLADGVTTVASQADPSVTVGAYNANHTIELTGLNATFEEGREYFVQLTGETGANAEDAKFRLASVQVTIEKL